VLEKASVYIAATNAANAKNTASVVVAASLLKPGGQGPAMYRYDFGLQYCTVGSRQIGREYVQLPQTAMLPAPHSFKHDAVCSPGHKFSAKQAF